MSDTEDYDVCPNPVAILWITLIHGMTDGTLSAYPVSVPWQRYNHFVANIAQATFEEVSSSLEIAVMQAFTLLPDFESLLGIHEIVEVTVSTKCAICKETLNYATLTEITVQELASVASQLGSTRENTLAKMVAGDLAEMFVNSLNAEEDVREMLEEQNPELILPPNGKLLYTLTFKLPACFVLVGRRLICLS